MSRGIFVDTGAWKAWIDKKDEDHQAIRNEFDRCRSEKIPLETSDYVVSETLTLLRMRPGLGHPVAVGFGEMVQSSHVIRIHAISSDLFQKAWKIFQRYSDKDFSFVDCTSFALMEKRGLKEVLALDDHFTQYGFQKTPIRVT